MGDVAAPARLRRSSEVAHPQLSPRRSAQSPPLLPAVHAWRQPQAAESAWLLHPFEAMRMRADEGVSTMACSHSQSCPLFAQFQLNTTLRSWKIMYCDSDTRSRTCQRFKLSESGHTVPLNLLPNGTMLDVGPTLDVGGGCGPAAPASAPQPAPAVATAAAAAPATTSPMTTPRTPAATPPAPAVAVRPATPTPLRPEPAAAPVQHSAAQAAKPVAPPPSLRRRSVLERIFGKRA